MNDEDLRLMHAARRGDRSALEQIYDRYVGRIYAYLYRSVGNRPLAEDLAAEVFLRMLEALRAGRFAETSLSGWLYRIAHNLVLDHLRRQPVPDGELHTGLTAPDGDVTVAVEQEETRNILQAALRGLTNDQRAVIVLRLGEGLSAAETGTILGKSEGAVWVLQHRALAALRESLRQTEYEHRL